MEKKRIHGTSNGPTLLLKLAFFGTSNMLLFEVCFGNSRENIHTDGFSKAAFGTSNGPIQNSFGDQQWAHF